MGSKWPGGFTASVAVTNLGDPVTGWQLGWTFPAGQRVTQAWNAAVTASGAQVTATNASYNAAIATNGTVSLGFNGSFTGTNTAPTSFTLNGADETSWGNPRITEALLDGVKAQGFKSIRIPVTWSAHGVPWRIDLRTYDVPQVQNATGTTAAFAIPTAFRGDQLATMEANYADGSNAGPQNWTPFKEFDRTFAPDYPAGTIKLTADLFAEIDDGARVTLKFHFWSGAIVTYYVTKSGSTVTGTTA